MRFQPVDHVPDQEFGYWNETFPIWHEQGLPKYVSDNNRADIFFGFETFIEVPVKKCIIPGFEFQVLDEDDRFTTILDSDGAKKLVPRDGHSTIPRFLKFPIEPREDWNEF